MRVCDYVQVNLAGELTWLVVIDFVGKNEIIGIPLYEETYLKTENLPRVRVFKQSIIRCRKHRDWDELDFIPWIQAKR